ncbi:hypothetical protein GMDG_08715, partial [Pseudogymnoascus destructans 20631-21]
IASEVQSLRCTTRLSNDLQKAIHRHLPDVALAEEYESSDSEDDADREHPMFQHAPYAVQCCQLLLLQRPYPL